MNTIAKQNTMTRNNVNVIGSGDKTLVLAHGFGCDQTMWRFLVPFLEDDFKLVLFDYVGCGKSDVSYFNHERYSTLHGYAMDLIDVCDALSLSEVTVIGHSVSSTISVIAANQRPDLISKLVLVCPSPCFLNLSSEYRGGFDREDLEELLNLMDKNHIGWANYLAPLVMGANDNQFVTELSESFCSTEPQYLKPFAHATFFSDHRNDFKKVKLPSLVLQSANDALASQEVGQFTASALQFSTLEVIEAQGHCLHMTNPEQLYTKFSEFWVKHNPQ